MTLSESIKFADNGVLKLIKSYDNLYYTTYGDAALKTISGIWGEISGQLGI